MQHDITLIGCTAMVRTQVQFTEEQIDALRARAVREEVSVAELVRRVEAWITTETSSQDRKRRALRIVGRFASGHDDVARRHDEHLVEAFRS